MKIDPEVPGEVMGEQARQIIKLTGQTIGEKDDDFILLIIGSAGTGKSTLGLHAYGELVPAAEQDISQIALTKKDFAIGLKQAKDTTGFRYLQYDEGKLNRQEWQSTWNREVMSIYHDIRGLRIYHVWCTAYPQLLTNDFLDARVKGLIFIYTKDEHRPRKFLYFTKKEMLNFLEQNGKFTFKLLKKYGSSHAGLQSWFRDYQGPLKEAYLKKKGSRMESRVDEFCAKWMQDDEEKPEWLSMAQLGRVWDMNEVTAKRRALELIETGVFAPNVEYRYNGAGKLLVSPEGAEKARIWLIERAESQGKILPVWKSAFLRSNNTYTARKEHREPPATEDEE